MWSNSCPQIKVSPVTQVSCHWEFIWQAQCPSEKLDMTCRMQDPTLMYLIGPELLTGASVKKTNLLCHFDLRRYSCLLYTLMYYLFDSWAAVNHLNVKPNIILHFTRLLWTVVINVRSIFKTFLICMLYLPLTYKSLSVFFPGPVLWKTFPNEDIYCVWRQVDGAIWTVPCMPEDVDQPATCRLSSCC